MKCGIRQAEAFPMTDGGTLIMRNGPASSRPSFGETRYHHSPSIAPFAIDLEDEGPPVGNSDALGTLRHTSSFDYSRSTTNTSFWSGLVAGLATIGVGVAIAFTAFTSEPSYATTAPRSPHVLAHVASSLSVETVELSDTKFVAKKKHRAHRVVQPAVEGEAPAEVAAPEAPEPTETE